MMVSREQVETQLEKMSKLPVLPQILVNLNRVASDEAASAEDLGKVILKDQSLTMRVLKVVNSAYYRRHSRQRITTVTKAVVILGFNGIRRLALGLSVFEMLRSASKVPALHDFWCHSLLTAIGARLLAVKGGYTYEEEAFVCGLVHDIGKLVLAYCAPEEYGRILSETSDRSSVRRLEREIFGLHHGQAGRKLAARWGMPPVVLEAISEHHRFDLKEAGDDLSPLLQAVIGADRLATVILRQSTDQEASRAAEYLVRRFDLNHLEIEELQNAVVEEYADLAQVFQLDGGPEPARTESPAESRTRPEVDRDEMLLQLQQIVAAAASAKPAGELVSLILDGLMATLAVERLFLVLLDENRTAFRCHSSRGRATPAQELLFAQAATEDSLLVYCVREGGAILHGDDDAPWRACRTADMDRLDETGPDGAAVLPLVFRNQALGLLWLDNPCSRRALTAAAVEAAVPFANNLALVLGPGVPIAG